MLKKREEDGKNIEHVTYRGGEHTHDASRITRLNANDQSTFKHSVLNENLGQHDLIIKTETRPSVDMSDIPSPQNGLSESTIFPVSPRLVVETTADVDHNDDGYSWRKYGQKNVKGSSYTPRSYYRCTQEDCPVKKQVEQRGNSIFNTYEGTHNHLAPGWEEVNKKKKRKLSRTSMERSVIPRGMDSSDKLKELEITDKTTEENVPLKSFSTTPEDALNNMVVSESINTCEVRALIPLQDIQTDPNLSSLPQSLPIDGKSDITTM